mgnify:CR=1 FL=1
MPEETMDSATEEIAQTGVAVSAENVGALRKAVRALIKKNPTSNTTYAT